MSSVFLKRTLIAATLLGAWFFIHSIFVIVDGMNDELKAVDAAVVLGNKVELNGQPSDRLKARLDRTAELYDEGYFPVIIVSGGIGWEGFDEAKVMKSYLVDHGVPEEQIIEDNQGYNSYMTAQNVSKIMDESGMDSVMIVTQYYHVTRTKLAFRKMNIKDVYSAQARFFEPRDLYSIIREFPAYYKYLIKY